MFVDIAAGMSSPGGSPHSVRTLKNKAKEAAYMYRDGYLSSKAYQRRMSGFFTLKQLRIEKMRMARSQRPEVRQMAWESYRAAKHCREPEFVLSNMDSVMEEAAHDEAEAWSLLQYEQLLKDESELLPQYLDDETAVWCPLCEKGLLECPDSGLFACPSCGANLPNRDGDSLEHLEVKIFQALEEHELQCRRRPQFLLTPAELGEISLLLVCDGCCMSCDISGSDFTL